MKNINIELLDKLPFLEDEGVSFLGSHKWLKTQFIIYESHFRILVATNNQNTIVAWLPLWSDNKKIFKRIATLPLQPSGGPYFKKIDSTHFNKSLHFKENIQNAFFKFLNKRFERLTLSPEDNMVRAYPHSSIKVKHTLLTTLTHKENWPSDTKRFIKKAIKNGYQITDYSSIEEVLFKKIYNDVFSRKALNTHFDSEAYKLWNSPENPLRSYILKNNNSETIGFFAWAEDCTHKKCTLIFSSILDNAMKNGAQYLIYDFILNHAPLGYTFDFAGADDIGVSYLKEHFATQLTQRFLIESRGGSTIQKSILNILKK
jgi:glycosyltransferase involved in cell wall biosynthesis